MALDIHIVNVGKGSCTIIDHPSKRLTVIDIDDSRAISDLEKALLTVVKGVGLTNPLDYLNQNFPQRSIFRFILTHPDMDHMSGIKKLFSERNVSNFWDTENNKNCDDWENSPYDQEDWDYYQNLHSKSVSGITVLKNLRGTTGNYWTDDNIQILHPHPDLSKLAEEQDDFDHISQVLKVSHAGKSVLICGDATVNAQEHMLNDQSCILSADILLAPGHGSENHVHEDAIMSVGHKITAVSVAEGVDYDKNFYEKFGPVLSTKYYGNIRIYINDSGEVYFRTQVNNYSDQWYQLI